MITGATITADRCHLGTTSLDGSDRLIYNQTNGNLLFDRDGTGSSAAIQIATLTSKPTISASDFTLLI